MDRTATFRLRGAGPLAWGRYFEQDSDDTAATRGSREAFDTFEERSWQLKFWADNSDHPQQKADVPRDGHVYIPGIAICNCLQESANHLKMKVKGQGTSKYGAIFRTGLELPEDCKLYVPVDKGKKPTVPIMRMNPEQVKPLWLHVPSTGVRGAGKRVLKAFPRISHWTGVVSIIVSDDMISDNIFLEHLEAAGRKVGFGFWRRAVGGHYGRFIVDGDVHWS